MNAFRGAVFLAALPVALGALPTVAGQAPVSVPDKIAAVLPAGDRVLVVDSKGAVWSRNGRAETRGDWERVELDRPGANIRRIICSIDGRGECAILFTSGNSTRVAHLPPNALTAKVLDLEASHLVGIFAPGKINYVASLNGGQRQVAVHDIHSGISKPVGILAPTESGLVAKVGDQNVVLALSSQGSARNLTDKVGKPIGNTEFPTPTPFGSLYTEQLYARNGYRPGYYSFGIGKWTDSPDRFQPAFTNLSFPAGAAFLPFPNTLTASASGDLFAVLTGKSGKAIGYLCSVLQGKDRFYKFSAIAPLAADESAEIFATGGATGAYAVTSSPRYGQKLRRIDFVQAASGELGARGCNGELVKQVTLLRETSPLPVDWIVGREEILGKDGTRILATVLRPAEGPIKGALIDVYGAYGAQRKYGQPDASILSELKRTHMALVIAAVRGDGELGFDYGMASRTPNRAKAVDDLIAVADHVKRSLVEPGGTIIARGHSAGGWLSFRAALQRPDLFAGAIGYSGAYLFADNPRIASDEFFGPEDSLIGDVPLAPKGAQCPSQRFILIHAKDDPVTSFSQAEAMHRLLLRVGCKSQLIALERGGHDTIDFSLPDVMDWGRVQAKAYFGLE